MPCYELESLDQFKQIGSAVRQALGAGGTQMHIVFQTYSTPPRKIDARLYRDHGMERQCRIGAGRKPGCLMHFQPKSMTQRMPESIAQPPGGDHLASQGVTLTARHPGSQV